VPLLPPRDGQGRRAQGVQEADEGVRGGGDGLPTLQILRAHRGDGVGDRGVAASSSSFPLSPPSLLLRLLGEVRVPYPTLPHISCPVLSCVSLFPCLPVHSSFSWSPKQILLNYEKCEEIFPRINLLELHMFYKKSSGTEKTLR